MWLCSLHSVHSYIVPDTYSRNQTENWNHQMADILENTETTASDVGTEIQRKGLGVDTSTFTH